MSIPFNKLALTHRGAIVSHGAEIDTDTIDGVRCCNVWRWYTRCIVAVLAHDIRHDSREQRTNTDSQTFPQQIIAYI